MNTKQSIASRARALKIPKEKRVAMMRELGKKRQAKMSEQERAMHAKRMVNAREKKRHEQAA